MNPMKSSLIALAIFATFAISVFAQEIERRATWSVPLAADVKAQVDDYATAKKADETTRLKLAAIWPDEAAPASGADLLERVGMSFSVLESKAKMVVDFCQNPRTTADLPKFEILTDESAS